MKVGIIGCGAIANIITGSIAPENNGIEIAYFFDKDVERAENLASLAGGVAVLNFDDMLNDVDLVLECASPDSVKKYAPIILKKGIDMITMSIGAFMDKDFYNEVLKIARENNAKIHLPSGAVVGLDGIKAVAKFGLKEINLVTRKSPRSLGKNIDIEEVLFEGKASEAVKQFPLNINVAATISMACNRDIDVKIIVDPKVDRNVHEITAKGDFGEFKTTTMNFPCEANPKTSMLAALSAIRLLKSFNETISVGM
ncbi:MAG: aspartate dehydrogenase [archaeon]|uniref:L-aspartate dehydrogenase n=1 Tax=Methanobrevibacter gottschalkii DSM 11977 TaxID=1122229 RepID=A0A3N5C2T1_9EURY|nr:MULTISPECIES: aspartate dehydrogenase [Methanobrevibacter]MCQ2970538.1 aspartate dehydrogenase [archaeon]OED00516.1 aspartate dehydrogenase [Methanobrevibacter sp. A27]RPF50481.1 aspartate dehydrogenase [Methanobrevibacter gottschalkii DSM 11977]